MHDVRARRLELDERVGERPRELRRVDAEHEGARARRVRQRSEHVEDGTRRELAANGRGVPHGRMVRLREEEAEAELVDRALDPFRRQLELEAERLQHVRGPCLRRGGAVAVLRDRGSRGGDDERGRGRDVVRVRAVAAGADDVHEVGACGVDAEDVLAHRVGAAGDLVRRLALGPQGDEEASRRTGAACRIAGWCACAKRKPKPSSSIERSIRSGGRSSRKPSASSTSAEPGLRRRRAVAVLRDGRTGRRRDEGCSGRDVVRVRPVAAGADDVDKIGARRIHPQDVLAHRLGAASDLVRRFALRLAGRRGSPAICACVASPAMISAIVAARLVAGEVVAVEQPRERLLDHSRPSRKLRASAGPSGVSTDSGWNWTPTAGSSRCRTAITSPSSANAVGSSTSGSRVAASEW